MFLDHFCDEILDDNNSALGSNSSEAPIQNSDRIDTEDNHEIKDVGSEKADSHCRAKVDSNVMGEIQTKIKHLWKVYITRSPTVPKSCKGCNRCGQCNHFKRNCPFSKEKELSKSLEHSTETTDKKI